MGTCQSCCSDDKDDGHFKMESDTENGDPNVQTAIVQKPEKAKKEVK